MKLRYILSVLSITAACFGAGAQTGDSLSIQNASLGADSLVPAGSGRLAVNFYMTNLESLEKVYIKVGDAQDSGNLFEDILKVKDHKGQFYYFLDKNNQIIRNWGGHSQLHYEVSSLDTGKAKWVTIYAKKNNGSQTIKVYAPIH